MKLIIEISEEYYADIQQYLTDNDGCYSLDSYRLREVIRNGKTLPKGHGRLIDADAYQTKLEEKAKRLNNLDTINGLCGAVALLSDTETIIEADR